MEQVGTKEPGIYIPDSAPLEGFHIDSDAAARWFRNKKASIDAEIASFQQAIERLKSEREQFQSLYQSEYDAYLQAKKETNSFRLSDAEYERVKTLYGQEFADHARTVLKDTSENVDFNLCDWCYSPFPLEAGITDGKGHGWCCSECKNEDTGRVWPL